ncbi:MAG: HEPN domain-containing protein [Planctomycetes bacterium]|nr:HEPN domain-containing protein [Planctomycetota bacterium]
MPRKTDSNNPADWIALAESDLVGIRLLAEREVAYPMCHSRLAEVVEKILKAELIRLGWFLEKTHDLEKLAGELRARGSDLAAQARSLSTSLAEVYFTERYPGFDLDDPDWVDLRQKLSDVASILDVVKSRLTRPTNK